MNRTTLRLADDLRDLADQLEAGNLPERGAATALGRKVEAALNERRPKRRAHERTKQAHDLARLLSKRTGVDVAVRYSPYKDYGGPGWIVEWVDGPTHLRDQVVAVADRFPALDVDKLRYERGGSSRARIAAMLRYLDEHPEDGSTYAKLRHNQFSGTSYHRLNELLDRAHDRTEHPERIDEPTARRVRALCSLDGQDGQPFAELAEQIRTHGWPAARDWLHQLADDLDNRSGAQG